MAFHLINKTLMHICLWCPLADIVNYIWFNGVYILAEVSFLYLYYAATLAVRMLRYQLGIKERRTEI